MRLTTRPPRDKYFFSWTEIYGLKVLGDTFGRHWREDPSVGQGSNLVQRCCFLTAKPFLAHTLLLLCTDLARWCWGIDSGCLPLLDGRRWTLLAGACLLTAVSYIVCTQAVSRYIRTVPATAKWAFLNNIVYESTCVCVCVCSCMCVSTCSVHHGWRGGLVGQLRSLFGVRLPVSDIHQGRYPAGAHMNKCIEANAFISITSRWKCPL